MCPAAVRWLQGFDELKEKVYIQSEAHQNTTQAGKDNFKVRKITKQSELLAQVRK